MTGPGLFLRLYLANWPRKQVALALVVGLTAALAAVESRSAFAQQRDAEDRRPPWTERIELGGLFYLSYQDGNDGGNDYSRWRIKRGHIDLRADLLPALRARFTTDVKHDATGEISSRVKFAYAEFYRELVGLLRQVWLELGQVRLPWIYFEESVYRYRLQDGTFMDRLGLASSADRGLTFGGLIGPELPLRYQERVSPRLPGRWGSFALGVYEGGGFTVSEENTNKVAQARLSVRPLPAVAPGLQFSTLAVHGRGNTEDAPIWRLGAFMVSLEAPRVVVTAQATTHRGNPAGDYIDDEGEPLEGEGWSFFSELKLAETWSVIARQDAYDPDRSRGRDSWHRTILGLARHLGRSNMILLDWEQRTSSATAGPDDERLQLTLQLTI